MHIVANDFTIYIEIIKNDWNMIVDTMTYTEKREAYRRDFNINVLPVLKHYFGREKQYVKIARSLPNDKKYRFKPVEYISKEGNRYIIFFSVNGKNGYKKAGILFTIILIYRTNDGKIAVMDESSDGLTSFWSQHFFERYRERGLKDMNLSLEDTIIQFFSKIGFVSTSSVNSEKYKNNIYSLLNDGIMLGELIINEEMMVSYRTFISNEMLQGDQYDELAYLIYSSLKDTNNNYRPDFIKKYEERHKGKITFYGRPLVLKGCNDDSFSFYNVKRFDSHEKAIEEFISHYLAHDFYIDRESERLRIWFNYTKNQRKKGNTDQMCLAPLIYHTNTGLDVMSYRHTTYHGNLEDIIIVAPYIVNGEVFIASIHNTGDSKFLVFSIKLTVIEAFRNQREELKDWSLAEVYSYFSLFFEFTDVYLGKDNRILMDSSYGQFSAHQIGKSSYLCIEELNEKGTYTRLDKKGKENDYSWIKKKSYFT